MNLEEAESNIGREVIYTGFSKNISIHIAKGRNLIIHSIQESFVLVNMVNHGTNKEYWFFIKPSSLKIKEDSV